jgi:hypothetical protein
MEKGRRLGASEMMRSCSDAAQWVSSVSPPRSFSGSSTHSLDLDLGILNTAALDGLERLLHGTLNENDRLGVDALGEADHLLRDELGLDLHESLNGVVLLTEDEEDHLGSCRM